MIFTIDIGGNLHLPKAKAAGTFFVGFLLYRRQFMNIELNQMFVPLAQIIWKHMVWTKEKDKNNHNN